MKPSATVLAALVFAGAALGAAPFPAAPTRQVVGVLEEVDFIHRTGRFRTRPCGECVDFVLAPDASVEYLNAGADLRDLPLGSAYEFTLHRNAVGRFTRAVAVRDRSKADIQATARQRQRYAAFVKARGLPARVVKTDGKTLTLSVFGGEPATSEQTWPGDSSRPGRVVRVAVANDELRTWNPPVDHESGKIVAFHKDPPERRGGVRLVVAVNFMLEGFRRGRYVRVFPDAWPLLDQPFGEQLFHYGARSFPPELAESPAKEYPEQYPFRTDYGNAHLPWYRLKAGVAPPPDSEHRAFGELLAVGADRRSGRFRLDNSAEEVEFHLIPGATVRSLNAAADLADIPVGTRYRFHLYQDDSGAFRQVNLVTDEVSDLVHNGVAWRIESVNRGDGTLTAARQPPGVKNDQGDPEQPPDIGRALLRTGPATRFWKGDKRIALADLAAGDRLLVDRTGDRPGRPSRCTDVWVGAEAHKKLPNIRRKKSAPPPTKGTPR